MLHGTMLDGYGLLLELPFRQAGCVCIALHPCVKCLCRQWCSALFARSLSAFCYIVHIDGWADCESRQIVHKEHHAASYSFTQCPNAEFAKKHGLLHVLPLLCNSDFFGISEIHGTLMASFMSLRTSSSVTWLSRAIWRMIPAARFSSLFVYIPLSPLSVCLLREIETLTGGAKYFS